MGHTAVGVDLLDEAVRVAKEAVSRSEVLEADAAHLPFEDGSFDRLVSHHLVEHLENLTGALAEWRRVLAPGALVTVCTPNILYQSPRIFEDPTHVRIYDRAGLERAVKSAGFCVDRCVTIFPGLVRDRISVRVGVPLYRVFYRLPYFRDRGRSIVLGAHLG
jgi:ubiquinone/menaquinone biosynthesis C-methylase UbiE